MTRFILCFYFILSSISDTTASGIKFKNVLLGAAIDIAKKDNKLVFIDTYTTWCAPCKKLDKIFTDSEVGKFFNSNFVNLKIDMEGAQGPEILNKYNVVFLPTILILDQYGEVLAKVERLVNEEELLNIGKQALSGSRKTSSVNLSSTPFSNSNDKKESDYDPNDKEEVIYVYDARASSGRPHIMYHEAYLHLQLMDGKHQKVVKKYLSTQDDWTTEKNVKFIFDFLHDVRSEEFQFFIKNRDRFNEIIGKDKVDKSLSIIIKQRLEQGFPRPNLIEAIDLFGYLNKESAENNGYRFYLKRLLIENQEDQFINIVKEYLDAVNPYDHELMFEYVKLLLSRSNYIEHLEEGIELMKQAIIFSDQNSEYYFTNALLHYYNNDIESAQNSINLALIYVDDGNSKFQKYLELKEKISEL